MSERVLYLRVDVDFNVGLKKGVPFLLDLFDRFGIEATFFLVMGPDTLFRHSSNVKQKSFRQRLRALNFLKISRHLGLPYLKSRFLNQQVALGHPQITRAIVQRGHEVAIHGYNHAAWAEQCFDMSESQTRDHMDRAFRAFASFFPEEPLTWGAPNWRCNDFMFDYLDAKGVPYSSDTRGCVPFVPTDVRTTHQTLQFPITLPCLHELIQAGIPKASIPDTLVRCLRPNYNLFCIHDYYEGLLERDLFTSVVHRLHDEGIVLRPLKQAYTATDRQNVSTSTIQTVLVPGGARPVSCQEEFLTCNYFDILADTCRTISSGEKAS